MSDDIPVAVADDRQECVCFPTRRHDVDTLEEATPPPHRNKGVDRPAEDVSTARDSPTHTSSRTSKAFTAR